VNDDDAVVRGECIEPAGDGFLALGAAGYELELFVGKGGFEGRAEGGFVVERHHDGGSVDEAEGREAAKRVHEERRSREFNEGLGHRAEQAPAESGGGDEEVGVHGTYFSRGDG